MMMILPTSVGPVTRLGAYCRIAEIVAGYTEISPGYLKRVAFPRGQRHLSSRKTRSILRNFNPEVLRATIKQLDRMPISNSACVGSHRGSRQSSACSPTRLTISNQVGLYSFTKGIPRGK